MGNITETLRQYWKEGNWKEFNRLYSLGKWMIPEEEKKKIDAALIKKGFLKEKYVPGTQSSLLDEAMKIMPGSKIVQ